MRALTLIGALHSTFVLLPFEPGTGNFTKIVQRFPCDFGPNPVRSGWRS